MFRKLFLSASLVSLSLLKAGCAVTGGYDGYGYRNSYNNSATGRCVESGIGGAAVGAVIGAIVNGGEGAKDGAIIGGGVGCVSGAVSRDRRNGQYSRGGYYDQQPNYERNPYRYGSHGQQNNPYGLEERYVPGRGICYFEPDRRGNLILTHCRR